MTSIVVGHLRHHNVEFACDLFPTIGCDPLFGLFGLLVSAALYISYSSTFLLFSFLFLFVFVADNPSLVLVFICPARPTGSGCLL